MEHSFNEILTKNALAKQFYEKKSSLGLQFQESDTERLMPHALSIQ